ncbi:ABC transporter ATP-binding protein [Pleionea sp. CnH1-48]|uniref:ABC transporter ATP-binding protein n=1 Tax=Pleionea sp. CnH1-48 TaxID=2954494 RepID=UPI002097D236|nr:ABC transporter ATP-binding protein [Pleionea sp. CnH1-48]MCO7225836.1 ABC transporter ATP-binding protein [Pleionea sp. CnH1-48]
MTINACVSVQGLSKSYGDVRALQNIDFIINPGEIVALLGTNGAGKTTFINSLLGRVKYDSGSVKVFGKAPGHLDARRRTGTVLQSTKMPNTLTIKEHIELFSSYYLNPLPLESVLEKANLVGLEQRRFDALSGGQQQRLFFALAICGQPELVFLDEPTVGLDVNSRRDFWNCIRQLSAEGCAVLLTTHYLEEADVLADRISLLNNGSISMEGTPEQIKSHLGGKRIRFRSPHKPEDFNTLPDVSQSRQRGDYIELQSTHAEHTLKHLLNREAKITDLTVTEVSLEDAFIHLTEESPTTPYQEAV